MSSEPHGAFCLRQQQLDVTLARRQPIAWNRSRDRMSPQKRSIIISALIGRSRQSLRPISC